MTMLNSRCITQAAIIFSAVLIPLTANSVEHTQEKTMISPYKQKVVSLLKSIESGDSKPLAFINPNQYIQHNLSVSDGLDGFTSALKQLPKGSTKVDTLRVFKDGEFVFTHTNYEFFGPKVGFDIFRFENGMIVEHWDNLQEKPTNANPSGHNMLDGSTELTDLDKTEANKNLVRHFVDDILIHGRMNVLASYFEGDHYIQHNPLIADDLSGLGAALQAMSKQGITMKYNRIHQILGEGNFVLAVSEGDLAGRHSAFYDLFRVENSKIAEHWDTIESIPLTTLHKHANGKF
ncbi:hypothetical protein [Methylomonas sp. AM2-LC]|uniref:nuclear transport factor 2 family protein n=1 Tax=Methylomonas sp. AM2-LC TaxID=3153301 RepID=UPI00326484B7